MSVFRRVLENENMCLELQNSFDPGLITLSLMVSLNSLKLALIFALCLTSLLFIE